MTIPSQFYFTLSSTKPGADGSNVTEPTWPGYARQLESTATWAVPGSLSIVPGTDLGGIPIVSIGSPDNVNLTLQIGASLSKDYFKIAVINSDQYLSSNSSFLPGTGLSSWTWVLQHSSSYYANATVRLFASSQVIQNTLEVDFGTVILTPNLYQNYPYYAIYDTSGNFITAGTVFPNAYVSTGDTISFLPGNILINFDTLGSIPQPNSIAFPTIGLPPFVPTYEPAIYSVGVLYGRHMRS